MANYRKSFNLRNGVQVDDDNFIVNANGLVGIGTSIPTEFLDVRGNAKVVGLTTTNTLYSGIATIGSLDVQNNINCSGIITATIFVGSAAGLTGIYAIATNGWIINTGNSSISTTSKVGIGTTNPQYALQIGNPVNGDFGVYIDSSNGNLFSSGEITGTTFYGDLDAGYLTGTISTSRFPNSITIGIITATTNFYGDLVGTASTANSITNTANLQVNSVNSGFSTTGIATVHNILHVVDSIGVGTANPNSQIHVRKSGISSIQLTSDGSNSSTFTIGRNVTEILNNGQFRFGNTNGTFPDSTEQSFDIINYDTGNLNFYLNPGGVGTGSFNWFKPSLGKSMVLTSAGNLGINSDSPSSRLSIVGDVDIAGIITATTFVGDGSGLRNVSIPGIATYATSSGISTSVIGGIGSISSLSVSGISTLGIVQISSGIVTSSIGIGTTNPQVKLDVLGANRFGGVFERVSTATTYLSGSSVVLELDCQQSTTYTYTLPASTNVGIVSFKNMLTQTGVANATTVTVLFTQNATGTGNTTSATGIGTNVTVVGYENGAAVAGISTRAFVGSGTTVTLSTTGNDLDFVSFYVYYNGGTNTSVGSYKVYATKNGGFR